MIPLGVLAASRWVAGTGIQYADAIQGSIDRVFDIGSLSPNRNIIVGVMNGYGGTPSGILVDGVAIEPPVRALSDTNAYAAVHVAGNPAGTTFTVTADANLTVAVWVAHGTLTPHSWGASGAANPSVTLTAPDDCVTIAAYATSNGVPAALSGVTNRHRHDGFKQGTLCGDDTPASGSHTVSAPGGPNYYNALVVVDFTIT